MTSPVGSALAPAAAAHAGGYVQRLAWSPDGRLLAAATADGAVALFDAGLAPVASIEAHADGLLAFAWRPDGGAFATGGQDGTVRVFTAEGRPLHALAAGAWVEAIAWCPEGAYLAAAAGRLVRLWTDLDRETPTALPARGPHASTVTWLAWRADGEALFATSYGGVSVWRTEEPSLARHLPLKGSLLVLAVSPNGAYLATGNQDKTVHLWLAASDGDLEMHGYASKVRELAWDDRSRFLATGGSADVTLWDMRGKGPAGSRPCVLSGHGTFVSALGWQPGGPLLASAGLDGHVLLWRPQRGYELRGRTPVATADLGEPAVALAWRPDGRLVVAAGRDGALKAWRP